MLKQDLINKIENSKLDIKEHIQNNNFNKEYTSEIIKNILDWEAYEIQVAINLYYIDWCSIEEIAEILDKSEINVLNYFQLILFKIKLILNVNKKIESIYSAKNYSWKKKNYNNNENWSLLDEKI